MSYMTSMTSYFPYKYSNVCDHGAWSTQTDRRTDRRTDERHAIS